MKVPKIFSAIAAAAIMFAASAGVSAAPQFADFDVVDGVNWQEKVIVVSGEGIVPPDAVNMTQAKRLASQAAKADAYRKLGEYVNGVRVEGETTVEKLLTTQDKVQLKVSATIKGAKVIKEGFLTDGAYRVIMQVPLFGVSNSLAGAVLEKPTEVEDFPEPDVNIAPAEMPYDSSTPVKRRIEITKVTIEEEVYVPTTPAEPVTPTTPYVSPLTRMSVPSLDTIIMNKLEANLPAMQTPTYQPTAYDTSSKKARRSVADYASMAKGDYTGLVVDCRGLDLQPVMSPVVKNLNGTKIYGHKNLDIDKVISMGMADYVDDTSHFDRAGKNPLVVKAASLDNFNSNPVLSVPDSNRVLIENYATKFLKDLKVVFLFD